MNDELRPLGPGRFGFVMTTPWGQEVPAEVLVSTRRGWPEHPEATDPRWLALPVGPVVLGIRLAEPTDQPPALDFPTARADCRPETLVMALPDASRTGDWS